MWGHLERGMAKVAVGDKLATSVNCSQGAGADSDGSSFMGTQMVGHGGAVCVRQRSSSSGVELRVCKRWGPDAPAAVFVFYCSIIQLLVQCMPHPRQT